MVIDIVLHYVEGHGGSEELVKIIAKNLTKRGHRVRVLFAYFPEHIEWLGSLPEKHFFGLKLLQKKDTVEIKDFVKGYAEKLREIGLPDICIGAQQPFTCQICYEALYQEIGVRIPIISWLHAPTYAYCDSSTLKYATDHLAISHFMEQDIKSYIVHTPIYYVGIPLPLAGVNEIPRSEEGLQLLYVGHLVNTEKRIDQLLKALATVDGQWRLTVIGEGIDKEMLEELSEELKISDKVVWKGWQKQPWEQVKAVSLVLLGADCSAFSLVAAEALARGIPVLAPHCEGTNEIIHQGENGWFFDLENDKSLTDYITQLLDGKLKLPESQKCKESIKTFDEEVICKQIEKILYETRARLTWNQLYEHMGPLWGKTL